MGIHNERGIECRRISETTRESFTSELIADVCGRIDTALQQRHDVVANCASLAVMVNNLGAVSQAEMLIVNKCVADFIYGANASVFNGTRSVHMFTGSFMTSLQMTGISVTCFLIPSDDGHMAHLLHAPTAVTAWNSGFRLLPPAERPIDVVPGVDAGHLPHPTGPQYSAPSPLVSYVVQPQRVYSTPSSSSGSPLNGAARGTRRFDSQSGLNPRTERYIIAITNALIRHANELGNLDSRIGDGDMGDTGNFVHVFLHILFTSHRSCSLGTAHELCTDSDVFENPFNCYRCQSLLSICFAALWAWFLRLQFKGVVIKSDQTLTGECMHQQQVIRPICLD